MTILFDGLRQARRGIEKLLAPQSNVSYAQSGEDLVLDFLTDYRPSGYYIDVGCNDPRKGSNSYRFYRKGWRGIAVDANAAFGPRFRRIRPRDRFVQACVSDSPGEVDFHVFKGDALSSISGKQLYDNAQQYSLERVDRLATRTLNDILISDNAPAEFDFLSIDVEGHDEAVLRSIDLDRFSPHIILVELNDADLDLSDAGNSRATKYLSERGYSLVAMHWSNLFFRRVVVE